MLMLFHLSESEAENWREFVEKDLGHEGMKKTVIVVSTSDQPAPMRIGLPYWQLQLQKDLGMRDQKCYF